MQFRSGSQTPSRAATTGARTVQLTPGSGKHRSLTQSIRIWLSVHRDSVSVARMLFLLCIVLLLIPLALYYLPNPTTAVVNADEANDSQVLVAIPDHMPEVVEDDALPAMLEEEEEKEANGEDIGIENQALLPADADAEENRKSSTTTSRQSRSASIGKKLPASQAVGNWPSTTDAEALALVQNERRIAEVRREIALELIELWDRYIECACTEIMCADLVKTISCRGGSEGFNLALTLVDALDTLIIIYQTESLYLQSSQHLSLMSEAELAHMKQAIDYARNYVRDKLVIGANSKSAILKQDVSMFETTIRVVGGLLSAHYLTVHPIGGSAADQAEQQAQQEASTSVYLERCVELADKLMNAFPNKDDDPRMLPHATINLMKNTARNPSFSRGGALSTSEGASLQLEYVYLSALTGNPTYARNALSAQQFVVEAIAGEEAAPLLKQWIGMSEKRRGFTDAKTTIGSRVDSAYEYMVKVPLQLALHTRRAQVKRRLLNEEAEEEKEEKEEKEERKEPVEALNEHRAELEALRAKFKKAHGEDEHGKRNAYIRRLLKENTLTTFVQRVVPRFEKYLLARSTNDLLVFIERHGRGGDLGHHRVSTQFDHLNCFIVGTFAMAAEVETDPDIADKLMRYAHELALSCAAMYFENPLGLSPEIVYFKLRSNKGIERNGRSVAAGLGLRSESDFDVHSADRHNLLRPEAVEANFYMWRTSHLPRYRAWNYNIFKRFKRHLKKDGVKGGYSTTRNCITTHDSAQRKMDDSVQSFFLAETLKYLYLSFTDDSVMDLSRNVFNTEAHPVPVLNENQVSQLLDNLFGSN